MARSTSTTPTLAALRSSRAIGSRRITRLWPIPAVKRLSSGWSSLTPTTMAAWCCSVPTATSISASVTAGPAAIRRAMGKTRARCSGPSCALTCAVALPMVVPPDNPFVGQSDRRPEIWAYGLRNPWRFSFDRLTGDLYIADVGQNAWEGEVSFQPASSKGGENYGWKVYEGSSLFQGPPRAGLTAADQRVRPAGRLLGDGRLRLPGPATARARRQLSLWRLLHRIRLGADAAGRWLVGADPAIRHRGPDFLVWRGWPTARYTSWTVRGRSTVSRQRARASVYNRSAMRLRCCGTKRPVGV